MEIACEENSKLLTATDLAFQVRAVNRQMELDWAPAYMEEPWPCRSYATLQGLAAGSFWPLAILDDLDGPAGAIGFHDWIAGLAYGRVLANGDPLDATTLSHEALELRGDPRCDLWLPMPDGRQIAREMCLAADTIVPQGDGSTPTIRDLAVRGGDFEVLARTSDGKLTIAKAANSRRTGSAVPVVRVYLTDGTSIRCTDNHRIMMPDGSFEEAKKLRPGERLSDTLPGFSGSNSGDRGSRDAMSGGEKSSLFRACPDRIHRSLGQFRRGTGSPSLIPVPGHATFCGGVQHVDDVRADKQMVGPGADRVVARMADLHPGGHRADVGLVGQPVNQMVAPPEADLPIAFVASGTRPIPASFIDLDDPSLIDLGGGLGARQIEAGEPSIDATVAPHSPPVHWAEALRAIRSLTPSDCANSHEKIVDRVEADGHDDVYDLTVPVFHNFAIGAGFFVHNCDPCEGDRYDVEVTIGSETRKIWVSDFVLPAYFVAGAPGPYSFLDTISEPFGLSRNGGGYRLVRDHNGDVSSEFGREDDSDWDRVYDRLQKKTADPRSRTARRGLR